MVFYCMVKLNIRKTKIMASSPITSWQIGLQIPADDDCSHEIKRCLILGRKAMTNLDRALKIKDIILPTKVCIVKAIYGSFQ